MRIYSIFQWSWSLFNVFEVTSSQNNHSLIELDILTSASLIIHGAQQMKEHQNYNSEIFQDKLTHPDMMSLFNSGCWSKCFHLVGIWKILRIKVTSHHSRKINWWHLYLKIYIFGQHFSAMPFTHSSHNVFSTKDVPEIHQITAKKQLWLVTSFPQFATV